MLIALLLSSAPVAAPVILPTMRVSERQANEVKLGAADLFHLAEAALAKGDTKAAEAIYSVMQQDSDSGVRAEARFRLAKLYIRLGRRREAAVLLRRVLDEKPGAVPVRLSLAKLLAELGEQDAALRELRAAQASGLPAGVARLVDRYSEALRASRRRGLNVEIALAPSSNINRATNSDILETVIGDFEIDRRSQAKSGVGVSLRGQAYQRVPIGRIGATLLMKLSGSADLYTQKEFNDVAIDFTSGPEFRLGKTRLNLELGGTRRWYGQKPFLRSEQVVVTVARPLGSLAQLRLTASAARLHNQFNDLQDGHRYSGRLSFERALSSTTGVGLNLSASRDALREPAYSTKVWTAGVIGWREVGRMTFTLDAQFGKLVADRPLALFKRKRSDTFSSLSLGATFRQLQYHGFAPLVRMSLERNSSPIAFYDYQRTRVEVGVARAF